MSLAAISSLDSYSNMLDFPFSVACFTETDLVTTDLTSVVQCDSIGPSHHYLRGVFIHGTLAVSHIGDILNHHLKEHTETVNKSDQSFSLNIHRELIIPRCLSHSHSGQVFLQACTVWGLTGPCHPPRCSWRSLWSGTAAEPTGSSHRCCRGDCSWRWRSAVKGERSLLKSLCSENTCCKF